MKIVIIGAGIMGVTSAYFLSKMGHEVTVIEKNPKPAEETSYANGGQLSYSYSEPLASLSLIPKIPKYLFGKNTPISIKFGLDTKLYTWLLRFMYNCRTSKFKHNNKATLNLSLYSRQIMHQIVANENIEFNYTKTGKIHLYDNIKDFNRAKRQVEEQNKYGCAQQILSYQEALKLEPSLQNLEGEVIGAIYSPLDESGDANAFTKQLAKICEKNNVKFHFGTSVEDIVLKDNAIARLKTTNGSIKADKYIIAAGVHSPQIIKKIGINLPIYPMKGYSLTAKANNGNTCPQISVTDTKRKTVYTRLGDKLRVAGIAQFHGYDTSINKKRIGHVTDCAKTAFPLASDYKDIKEWTGLRPMTPDSLPILGASKMDNLYFNTGQGMLGWTLACGSSKLVADIISGNETKFSCKPYKATRFFGV